MSDIDNDDGHDLSGLRWMVIYFLAVIAFVTAVAMCSTRADAAEPAMIEVVLDAQASGAISPVNVTLTWSAPGAVNCAASGGWSGAKAPTGSEVISGVRAPGASFGLHCVGEATAGEARVSWVAPTTNTDGSEYANAKGFTIHYGTSPSDLVSAIGFWQPTGNSYTIEDLDDGTYHFCVRAVSDTDQSSECSNIASKTVAAMPAPTGNGAASVEVDTRPGPPTAVAAQ